MALVFTSTFFGGANYRDAPDALLSRTHGFSEGVGWAQRPGVGTESPELQNSDFDRQGLRKRLGSEEWADLTSVLVADETLLGGFASENSSGSEVLMAVGAKSMYTNQSGSWVQINDSGSSAYTHSATVSKFSHVRLDGRDFIGLDGANKIQVWRGGADLDDEAVSGNTYVESGTGTSRTYDGTWDNGAYALAAIHGRLVYSTGNNVVNPLPLAMASSSGIWEKSTAPRAAFADGRVRMLATFVPWGGDDQDAVLYVGHDNGVQFLTGFTLPSDHWRDVTQAEPPINHQAWFVSRQWLFYLSDRGNILAINGTRVVDVGSRLHVPNGTGPLDEIDIATSKTNSWGFYNTDAQQGMLSVSTSTARVNDLIIVIDMKQGEPMPGEQPGSWEPRMRLLPWRIDDPDANDWFANLFRRSGAITGVMGSGKLYTLGSGNNDLGTIAIDWRHKLPWFFAGSLLVANIKQMLGVEMTTVPTGDWNMAVNVYLDQQTEAAVTFTFSQVPEDAFILDVSELDKDALTSVGVVRHFERLMRRAHSIQIEFTEADVDETAVVSSATLPYEVLSRVR